MVTASSDIFWVINVVICKKGKGQNWVEFCHLPESSHGSTSLIHFCICKTRDKSQEGGIKFNQEPSNALSLILQSQNQRLNSEEPYSSKISRTAASGKIYGFQICLFSHLWACPSVAYSKSWLTRASKRAFHLRKMVSYHLQQMDLMLLGNIYQHLNASRWEQARQ